ncbi:LarC family nickel insertion protein [Allorhodopirellula solitaria]|uniref:Uncharacterized protein n=1 Tax=Allorhodopirellula solitaria TaxID=2527987 RepID=A0A5C5XAP6_9BACT|nr:LarC family nickel insertion protein [Allorhodopirellula solitaria]TWT59255.1 hypothetical protein CA85_39510 [Allorhodopirellula solitaria]
MSRPAWLLSSAQWFVLMIAVAYVGGMTGCQPAESTPETPAAADHDHDHDHDGHDHDHAEQGADLDVDNLPELNTPPPLDSLDEGVEKLVSMRDEIAKGFADDDVDSIHDQLHGVGDLLGQIEEKVATSELSDDAKQAAREAVETLFDAYGEVDAKLHGVEGKDYQDVSEDIDSAIETLTNKSSS